MPVVAIVVGVLACIWAWYGVIGLHSLFWLVVFALGVAAVIWGANRLGWWHYPGRRGPPPTY